MMFAASLPPLLLAFAQSQILLYLTAFFVSVFGQSVKVTNDALVQSKIDDYFRGRVFAVYDVAVNTAMVTGAVLAALILPASGKSFTVPVLISVAYLLTAVRLLRKSRFNFTF